MKIEQYQLFEEIAEWISKNTDANEKFLPFVISRKEAARIQSILHSMSSECCLDLAITAKGNQSILQMIWYLCPFTFHDKVKPLNKDSLEYETYLLMTEADDQITCSYERHYRAFLQYL